MRQSALAGAAMPRIAAEFAATRSPSSARTQSHAIAAQNFAMLR